MCPVQTPAKLVPAEGFEPPTYGLQNRCTTTVLSRHFEDTASGPLTAYSTAAGGGAIKRLPERQMTRLSRSGSPRPMLNSCCALFAFLSFVAQ